MCDDNTAHHAWQTCSNVCPTNNETFERGCFQKLDVGDTAAVGATTLGGNTHNWMDLVPLLGVQDSGWFSIMVCCTSYGCFAMISILPFLCGWLWWLIFRRRSLQSKWRTTMMKKKKSNDSRITSKQESSIIPSRNGSSEAAIDRKRDFLQRTGGVEEHSNCYGYRDTPGGYIDDWRPIELPGLILPLQQLQSTDKNHDNHGTTTTTFSDDDDDNSDERQVYLDYAGSALPTTSQLDAIHRTAKSLILANPHSTGPAASQTSLLIQQTKKQLLDHFHATPGRFAGMNHPPPHCTPHDCHPGYELLFTSGTTESLRIVAERFPWSSGRCRCNTTTSTTTGSLSSATASSLLVYPPNAHTSVIGMRGPALSRGATFQCASWEDLHSKGINGLTATSSSSSSSTTESTITSTTETTSKESSSSSRRTGATCPTCGCCRMVPNLLVLPAECNFGGDRPNVKLLVEAAATASKEGGDDEGGNSPWYTLLDLAKAASTSPIDLRDLNPTFACLSFYKLFGEPTGLGALFVKRSSLHLLTGRINDDDGNHDHHNGGYFGGGSVDMVLAKQNKMFPRSEPTPLASLCHGTIHFRGIVALRHGLEELNNRLGGMTRIQAHTHCLAAELTRRFQALRHANGQSVIRLYGAWGTTTTKPSSPTTTTATTQNMGMVMMDAGPTVTFNVMRDDGSYVGYNEVSKLAALHHPPLQFRTGCFCNPGACQEALELTEEDILHNYETAGHVCGDHIDIVNGRPTGAIRTSFGKDSLWEDMDVLVTFLDRLFVTKEKVMPPSKMLLSPTTSSNVDAEESDVTPMEPSEVEISELYVFPIKSCAAQRVTRWKMEFPSGKLAFDREFALVDTSGTAMRLQSCPKMGTLRPIIDLEHWTMKVSAPGCEDLLVNLDDSVNGSDSCHNPSLGDGTNDDIVKVCGDKCGGRLWGDYATSEWFSSYLGVQCWLARASSSSSAKHHYQVPEAVQPHPTGPGTSIRNPHVAFANEQPLLLITKHAVDTLNKVLVDKDQQLAQPHQFRPNMVVQATTHHRHHPSGDDPIPTHIEDQWSELTLLDKNVHFNVKGNCARCAMVDFDPATNEKGKTLKALATYRRQNGQITFGIFLEGVRTNSECSSCGEEVWLEQGDSLCCTYKSETQ